MKYIIISILLNFILFTSFGQLPKKPYEPLQFENATPVWYKTIGDSVFKNAYYDEYNKLSASYNHKPIIKDEFIFTLLNVHGRDQEGGYIEKRRLATGERIWFNKFDLTTFDRQEVPRLLNITKEGHVEVISQRLKIPFSTNNDLYWTGRNMSLVYRKYHSETGQLLVENIPQENDSNALVTNYSAFTIGKFISFIYPEKDGNFRYIERIYEGNKYYFVTVKFDKTGHAIGKPDTVNLGKDTTYPSLDYKGPDTLIYLYYHPDDKKAYIQYYNYEFEKYNEVTLQGFDTTFIMYTWEVSQNYCIFYNVLPGDPPLKLDRYFIYVYDFKGQLLKQWKIDFEFNVYWAIQYMEELNELLIVESRYAVSQHPDRVINSFITKGDSLLRLKELAFKDPLRAGDIYYMQRVGDNILSSMFEGAFYYIDSTKFEQDIFAQAISMVLISPAELGLRDTLSASEPALQLSLYPNPGHDVIKVGQTDMSRPYHWEVFDMGGKKYSQGTFHTDENTIDISQLPPGLYFLGLYDAITFKMVGGRKFIKT
ncbi:MAG: T9SS type A sorting domain-containing protein [Saprospiraceae bacterium]|nr:T9SS type A sorting domain-containing protein [Saprospiraceae bacterium]